MKDEKVAVQAEIAGSGVKTSGLVNVDELVKKLAQHMLSYGVNVYTTDVDALHSVQILVEWKGKDPREYRGDDDCG